MPSGKTAQIVWHLLPPGAHTPGPASAGLVAELLGQGYSVVALPADGPLGRQLARERPDLIHATCLAAAVPLTRLSAAGPLPPVVVDCAAGESMPQALAEFLRSGAVARVLAADAATRQRLVVDAAVDPSKVCFIPCDPAAVAILYRDIVESGAAEPRRVVPPAVQPPEKPGPDSL